MRLSTRMRALGASLAATVLLVAATLKAQESTSPRTAPSPDVPTQRRPDPSRRVPGFFGQIGLTDEQKATIYKIQGKHQAKIDELQRRIDEIQKQMLAECEGVLTDAQRQVLAQRRKAASEKKRGQEPEKAVKGQNPSGR